MEIRRTKITTKCKYNYSKTNWNKFQKTLEYNDSIQLAEHRNLSINQIDVEIERISNILVKELHSASPNVKEKNSVEIYENEKIKKLKRINKKILIEIYRQSKKIHFQQIQ